MHVAFVLAGLGAGGAEKVVALLANAWVEQGRAVTILSCDSLGSRRYHLLDPRIEVVEIRTKDHSRLGRALSLVRRILSLRAQLKARRPDVVISFLTKVNVQTLLATRGLRIPVLVCERNNPERQEVRRAWRWLQERLGRRATLVLQTEASRAAFSSTMLERSHVIPNPVAPCRAVDAAETMSIVAVGRLVKQKGFDILLRAFAELTDAFPSWSLVIWGEGMERQALERLRDDLAIGNRVAMPGVTPEPGDWITSGSIFVLSSRFEGFPNVLVEAMSAGLAVVSFDCPWGPREIITHDRDGLLVPAEDRAALSEALAHLMSSPDLRRSLGWEASRSIERFGISHVIERWDAAIVAASNG